MKETYYFSHDYNAIQDPKMMSLLLGCGLASIGMYWILIEALHQQKDNRMTYKSYCDFVDFYGSKEGKGTSHLDEIKENLISSGLIIKDGEHVYSGRVISNMQQRKEISQKRSEAGKRSGEIRKKLANITEKETKDEQVLNKNEHIKGKERKGKEKKVKNISIAESNSAVVIPNLLKDKNKHITIIGLFAKAKGIEFASKEQQGSFIRRNLRAAKDLVPYTPDQLVKTMKYLKDNADYKWTLESVGKHIDEDVDKLENNQLSEEEQIEKLIKE